MHCLTVIYPHPDSPEQFKRHYAQTHIPLVKQLPGLKSCNFAFPAPLRDAAGVPFCIFQAYFENAEAMGKALQSEQGGKVAADVGNYSPKGATLFHYAVES